ncbi:hypothetical protein DVH05_027833 [Phytophthora capsici]|nr:hypothetical protein DVH05_027833 [Phytophthora capsici]
MVGLVSRAVKLNDENKALFQQMRDQGWTLEKVGNALNIPAKEATLSKTALLDDMDYWFYKLYEGDMAKNLGIRSKTSA